jgi:surfeit locus 1 family protein
MIPILAFALGTWQVKRLQWKTDMIAKYEDQLVRDPLPLPPHVNPASIPEFDFRRVVAFGTYRHDQEMLIGPRMRDGEEGYLVVTPLDRGPGASKILVCRGWISKAMKDQRYRGDGHGEAMPKGERTVEGLLREPPKKNFVTPENRPDKGEFYFPDVVQMAALVGAEPVWIEETMQLEFFEAMRRQAKGIPIGREPVVTLSNNHAQYIFTW